MPLRSSEQVVCTHRHNHDDDEARGAAVGLTLNVPRTFPSPGIETTTSLAAEQDASSRKTAALSTNLDIGPSQGFHPYGELKLKFLA